MSEWSLTRAREWLGCVEDDDDCATHEPCAWPCMSKSVVRLASLLDEHAAEVLEDAADKFQWGAWIDVLSGGLVQRRTDGEAVVRWLRERSRALRGEA